MSSKILPITGLTVGGISPDVIVCGDPGRAERVASFLQDSRQLAGQREYFSYLGQVGDRLVTVSSHGVGAPGAAIAFEELIIAGARRIIRVGTCGGLQPDILAGHLVVVHGAVQNTGYALEVAPRGYPAVADPALVMALQLSVEVQALPSHSGLVLTRDAFYGGVRAPFLPDYQTMSQANVLAVEMECAALFTVASLRGVQSAAILAVDGNVLEEAETVESYRPRHETVDQAVEAAIRSALQALQHNF